jgi:hypothetical protein
MALWECLGCTTAYAVDAPCCPFCGLPDHREQGETEEPASPEPVNGEPEEPAETPRRVRRGKT